MDKQIILIIVVTWILSLLTTLAIVYVVPSVFPTQTPTSVIQLVKFVEPNEVNATGRVEQPVSFVWTPKNPDYNVILGALCFLEYRCGHPSPEVWDGFYWRFWMSIRLGNNGYGLYEVIESADNLEDWIQSGITEWKQACFRITESEVVGTQGKRTSWVLANQKNYTIALETYQKESQNISTPTYIRNVNIMLEVVDG